jgi:hypothetical protein
VLPDGIFSHQKSQIGEILEGLARKLLVCFMANWSTYFMVVWSILWLFRLFYGHLVFFAFWYVFPRKIWQPWSRNDHAQYLGNGTIITKKV